MALAHEDPSREGSRVGAFAHMIFSVRLHGDSATNLCEQDEINFHSLPVTEPATGR